MTKKVYCKPSVELIEIEEDDELLKNSWSHAHDNPHNYDDHCSNCRWNPGGHEMWHCDHSINGWTNEPFYPDCDFYYSLP